MSKLAVGIIGCGYWGNHLVRNFYQSEYWNVLAIADKEQNQLNKIQKQFPNLNSTTNVDELFSNPDIQAIAIATPVASHYELAKAALLANKHVWLEKPLTLNTAQADELLDLAKESKLIINVDHTFIYTPAIQKIKEIIDSGELGDLIYFDSMRVNLGLFQHDVNVLWDLAPHDISILNYITNKKPYSVNATGKSLYKFGELQLEDIAFLTINFTDGTIAHINVNWLSPVKIRTIIIAGTKRMLVFDDMLQSEKIKIYDKSVELKNRDDIYNMLVQYRSGDMHSPALSTKEALKEEVEFFHSAIINGKPTITDGASGRDVVRILEAANESLKLNGAEVVL